MSEYNCRQPVFRGNITITISKQDQEPIELTYEGEIPEKLMDQAQKLAGNALARVGISVDFSGKNFGRGAAATAHVSLSCNQDMNSIQEAAQLAGYMATEFAKMFEANGNQEMEKILLGRGVDVRK